MPQGRVVFDGVPDECKMAFRKWDEKKGMSFHRKPMTVLPLNAAIEAVRR
jgi:hypothetical protein